MILTEEQQTAAFQLIEDGDPAEVVANVAGLLLDEAVDCCQRWEAWLNGERPTPYEGPGPEYMPTPEQIRSIVDVQLQRLRRHLAEQEITLELSDAAKDELAREGYDPEFGARPLKRALQKRVQNLLADRILAGELAAGDTAVVDFEGGEFRLVRQTPEPQPAGAAG